MSHSKDIFDILCRLSNKCNNLANNVIVHTAEMLPESPPEGVVNILHAESGYDLRIVLSACPDTAHLNCNYPCVIITPPNVLHYPASYIKNPDIIYMGGFINNFAIHHKSGIHTLAPQMSDKLTLRTFTPREIIEGLYEMASTTNISQSIRCHIGALLFELFALCFQLLELTKDTRRLYGLTDTALAIIMQSYYNPDLSAAQIAAQLGVTPNYLAALFKKADLLPIKKLIIQTRLKEARALLQKGIYSIKEVAYMTGWDNQFYFSNTFMKKYKVRPSSILPENPDK